MGEFNSCAGLVAPEKYDEASSLYDKLLSEGKDPYQTMLDMQNSLQVKLAGTYPDRAKRPEDLNTIGEIYDWIRDQKTAIDDEWSEMVSALPGVNMAEKDRSAIWKKWKKNHPTLREKKLEELTREELLELLFEKIDIVHFDMNVELALRMSAKDRFVLYYLKNAENFRRYESGY